MESDSASSPLEKAHWVYKGMYAPMIAEYLRYFEPADLLVIDNGQLLTDPVKFVSMAARHIGADPAVFNEELLLNPDGSTKTVFTVSSGGSVATDCCSDAAGKVCLFAVVVSARCLLPKWPALWATSDAFQRCMGAGIARLTISSASAWPQSINKQIN